MNYINLVNEKNVFQYDCVLCYDFEECYLSCIPEKETVFTSPFLLFHYIIPTESRPHI